MFKNLLASFKRQSKFSTDIETPIASRQNEAGFYFPQNVSMTPVMFERLYRKLIEQYAEIVQLSLSSESHHHSHLGGMLDHTLEVISTTVKL